MLKCHEIQWCFSGSPQGGRHNCTCLGGAQVLRGCALGRGEDELQCPGVGSRGAEGFGNLEGVGIWTPLQRVEGVSGCVQSCFSCLTLFDLINCSPPGSSVHGASPGKNTGVGGHASSICQHLLFSYVLFFVFFFSVMSNPMDYSTPGFPVLHHLLEFAQIHVH